MSLILEALKKSDKKRQKEAVPRLETVHLQPAPTQRRRKGIWILLLVLLGVGAWYYWKSKKNTRPALLQPHPPLGGLSPVSGFTGRRRK